MRMTGGRRQLSAREFHRLQRAAATTCCLVLVVLAVQTTTMSTTTTTTEKSSATSTTSTFRYILRYITLKVLYILSIFDANHIYRRPSRWGPKSLVHSFNGSTVTRLSGRPTDYAYNDMLRRRNYYTEHVLLGYQCTVRQIEVTPCSVLLISQQRLGIFIRKFTRLFAIHIYA